MDPTELQKQLPNLMAIVTKERRLRQKAKSDLAKAQQAAPQTNSHSKGPKISPPDKFDGSQGIKAKVFASQVGFYFIANTYLFPNNRSKIVFMLSYMTGQARAWAQCYTQAIFDNTPVTKADFSNAFQSMYFNTEKRTKAEKTIRALTQTKKMAEYTHQFNMYAHHTG